MKHLFFTAIGLAMLCGWDDVQAAQKWKPPSIEHLNLEDVTLEQALDEIRSISRKDDPRGTGLNIILLKTELSPIQTSARFSLQAKNVLYTDLFYAISKRLGLGYRIEQHAVVVASGSKIGLPPPKTEEAVVLSRKIRLDLELPEGGGKP